MIRRCLILCNGVLVALLMFGALNHIGAQAAAPVSDFAFVNGWWFNGQAFERRTAFSVNGRFTFKTPPRVDRTLDLEDRDKAAIQRYIADGVFYVKIQGNLPLTDDFVPFLP